MALAGIALGAIVAAGAIAVVSHFAAHGGTTTDSQTHSIAATASPASVDVYYLIDSEAQATTVLQAEAEASSAILNGANVPLRRAHVLLAATPEQVDYVSQLFIEANFGESLQMIDVRQRLP